MALLRCWRGRLLLTGLLVAAIESPQAQLVRLSPGAGEAGAESRGEQATYDGRPGASTTLYTEWFSLPLSGVVLDPRFLSYSAMLRPTWGQQSAYGQPDGNTTRNVSLSFSASLLPSAPLSLTVQSHRSSGSAHTGFGGETTFETGGLGGTLRVRGRAFPMFAEWSTRSVNDWWRGTANQLPLHRDETLRSFRITGQSAKLSAYVERTSFTDRIGSLGYAATAGSATHALRWGKGSSLETMVDASDRDGSDAHRRRALSERIHLQHTAALTTDYTLQWRRSSEAGTPSSSRSVTVGARYQPSRMLTAGIVGTEASSAFRRGGLASLAVAPSVAISVGLSPDTRLDGAISAGFERTSRALGDEARVQAVDELHEVDASRRFLLLHEAGDLVSVVVYNRDHTIAYVSGLDYRASPLGELILVAILPEGRIVVGDAVAVNYRYAVPQAAEHELRQMAAHLSVTREGLLFRQSVALRRGRALTAGGDDRLGSGDDYVTSLGVHVDRAVGRIDAYVERRMRLNSRTDFATSELRLGLAPPPLAGLRSTASTSLMSTQMNGQQVTLVTSNVAVSWTPRASLQAQTTVEHWLWAPRDQRRERFAGWTLDVAWRIGQLQTDWRYAYQGRDAAIDGSQHRFSVRLTRRF